MGESNSVGGNVSDLNATTKIRHLDPILSQSSSGSSCGSSRSLDSQLLDDKDAQIESLYQDMDLKRMKSTESVPFNQCHDIRRYLFCDSFDGASFEWSESTWSESNFIENTSSLVRDANTVERLSSWDSTSIDLGTVRFANPLVTSIKNR